MRHPILFAPRGRDLQILHVVSNCVLGYAHSGDNEWQVKMTEYGYHDDSPVVVTVKSIDEVIPALVERYENQPPSWHGDERLGHTLWAPGGAHG